MLITGKDSIQKPDNPSKKSKLDSIIDEKRNLKITPPLCKNKKYYVGGTNYKTRETDYYPVNTGDCAINLDDEHKNEKDDDYIEPTSEENDKIKSKLVKR